MEEEIERAMQHAPQPARQSMGSEYQGGFVRPGMNARATVANKPGEPGSRYILNA
jgi:hypothetical protein